MSVRKVVGSYPLRPKPERPAYPREDNRAHGRKLLADLDWLMAERRHLDHAPLDNPPREMCWICREAGTAAERIMAKEVGC